MVITSLFDQVYDDDITLPVNKPIGRRRPLRVATTSNVQPRTRDKEVPQPTIIDRLRDQNTAAVFLTRNDEYEQQFP
jgi:hypothetical protein